MQILGNQGVGFASGEWSGVSGTPLRQMYLAIVILILAVTIMASGNMMIDRRTENSVDPSSRQLQRAGAFVNLKEASNWLHRTKESHSNENYLSCVPNFLTQHFDPFNADWTQDLVSSHPAINPENGHLSLPTAPGLGLDLNVSVIKQHPYHVEAFLNINEEGWE